MKTINIGTFNPETDKLPANVTFDSHIFTVNPSAEVVFTGKSDGLRRIVAQGNDDSNVVKITLLDASIKIEKELANKSNAALQLGNYTALILNLDGENHLSGAFGFAGIAVPYTTSVDISGTGELDVVGSAQNGEKSGAAIGGFAEERIGIVTISGGVVNATGGSESAGIGGGSSGDGGEIRINGGIINAVGTGGGAGIGNGLNGKPGVVSISGGVLTATGTPPVSAIDPAIWISEQPQDVTVPYGKGGSITMTANISLPNTCNNTLTYQLLWYNTIDTIGLPVTAVGGEAVSIPVPTDLVAGVHAVNVSISTAGEPGPQILSDGIKIAVNPF